METKIDKRHVRKTNDLDALNEHTRNEKRLDPKILSVNETRCEGCRNVTVNDHCRGKNEAFKKKSCSKKQGQLELFSIECYPSSWSIRREGVKK